MMEDSDNPHDTQNLLLAILREVIIETIQIEAFVTSIKDVNISIPWTMKVMFAFKTT